MKLQQFLELSDVIKIILLYRWVPNYVPLPFGSAVYSVFARSQAETTQGTFNYNDQRDYEITVRCTDGKDTVTSKMLVNLIQNQPPEITNLPRKLYLLNNYYYYCLCLRRGR